MVKQPTPLLVNHKAQLSFTLNHLFATVWEGGFGYTNTLNSPLGIQFDSCWWQGHAPYTLSCLLALRKCSLSSSHAEDFRKRGHFKVLGFSLEVKTRQHSSRVCFASLTGPLGRELPSPGRLCFHPNQTFPSDLRERWFTS